MSNAFRSISLPEFRDQADRLLRVVLDETGRLTVDVGEADEVVVISKRELDSLEQALALLAEGSDAERLCRQVASETFHDAASRSSAGCRATPVRR